MTGKLDGMLENVLTVPTFTTPSPSSTYLIGETSDKSLLSNPIISFPTRRSSNPEVSRTGNAVDLESGHQAHDDGKKGKFPNLTTGSTSWSSFSRRDKIFSALRITLLIVVVIGACVFLGFLFGSSSAQAKSVEFLTWLEDLPKYISCILMILLYAIALVFFCPGTPFNLAAGFLYGLWFGFGVAMLGCVLGATTAFICGRTIAREWVKERMVTRPTFRAVDWAIQKNGIYIVFLTRLSPLFPFPLLNYAFGITKVSALQYLLGTAAGVFPATMAYTYLGTLMRNLADLWKTDDDESSERLVWMICGGLITIVSIIVISLITKRAISKATYEYEQLTEDEKSTPVTPRTRSSSFLLEPLKHDDANYGSK